jgi:hypothetical protein
MPHEWLAISSTIVIGCARISCPSSSIVSLFGPFVWCVQHPQLYESQKTASSIGVARSSLVNTLEGMTRDRQEGYSREPVKKTFVGDRGYGRGGCQGRWFGGGDGSESRATDLRWSGGRSNEASFGRDDLSGARSIFNPTKSSGRRSSESGRDLADAVIMSPVHFFLSLVVVAAFSALAAIQMQQAQTAHAAHRPPSETSKKRKVPADESPTAPEDAPEQ